MHYEVIQSEGLTGLTLSEDHGTSVTFHDWITAQRSEMEKGDVFDISRSVYAKEKSDDDYMRENLYNMKLQCLAEVLSKRSLLDVVGAEQDAKAINAAFDKITF